LLAFSMIKRQFRPVGLPLSAEFLSCACFVPSVQKLSGPPVLGEPNMSNTFNALGLPDPLVLKLDQLQVTEPFPVQAAAIPPALAGRDVQGSAPTGSGKTLAFGLPLLSRVGKAERNMPTALVLAPTRELAEQIRLDLDPLARSVNRRVGAVYGGVGYGPQLAALRRGVDVVVATPGRLEDLIERRSVQLEHVTFVVIDEADRMADMGFLPAVRRILDLTNPNRQTLLFSATLDGEVAVLSRNYQKHPVRVDAHAKDSQAIDVAHHFWRVPRSDRAAETARVVELTGRTIVFTRTRHGADRLTKQLSRAGVPAVTLHGGRSQSQRTRALAAFSSGSVHALVATDVAARGIHVDGVAAVVHFDLAADHKDYLHRSGRTARAGAAGVVVTLVAEGEDPAARKLLRDLRMTARIQTPQVERLGSAGKRPEREIGRNNRVPHKDRRRSQAQRSSQTRSVFVGNLPWRTTSEDLEELFATYGRVERATISTQARTGRSKGYGFVDIEEHHPNHAIEALNGALVGGRALRVRPAT
jgi:superfamily II DNA/RNA helicase